MSVDAEQWLFRRMRWNAPLRLEHAALLMDRLALGPGLRVADLGCGWGELLLQVVARANQGDAGGSPTRGIGVDTNREALDRGRGLARERGLGDLVEFVEANAAEWHGTADRVLCVGAPHAFGGTVPALKALAKVVPPGGRLLFGDACWTSAPTPAAKEIFEGEVLPLPDMLEECRSAGWRLIHMTTSDQQEWDDFESTFRAGRQEWLLAHPDDPQSGEIREWLDHRERQYVQDYRGVLDFTYLVLAR